MLLKRIINQINLILMMVFIQSSRALAQSTTGGDTTGDPLEVSNQFSEKVISIVKGPVLKVLAAVVLLVGVASLLRGRHKLALSCGVAFVLILFLPILLGHI